MDNKKILLFSYNPVPSKDYKTIEGSALRFWRMAISLKAKEFYDVTIAIWEKSPQKIKESQGIKLVNFNNDPKFLAELISHYDTVIFTCAMGDLSRDLMNATSSRNQVIIDAYSPMYVEFLTKSPGKKEDQEQLKHYNYYIEVFNEIIKNADYNLIANNNQRHLYRGVLAAQGALIDYDDRMFINLPAFVEASTDVKQKILKEGERISVLWFGGVYPWFDIGDIIKAFADPEIKKLAKLVVVGGSNPFYPKDNIRFNGKFIKAKELSGKLGLTNETILFQDWVEYYDRIKIFNESDIAISVNNQTIENDYSFRLRVADLVGNGLPVITNAGDPLGEELIDKGVAFRIDISSKELLSKSLKVILNNRQSLKKAKEKLFDKATYNALHIDGYINNLAKVIEQGDKPRLRRRSSAFRLVDCTMLEETRPDIIIDKINTKTLLKLTTKRIGRAAKVRVKRVIKK